MMHEKRFLCSGFDADVRKQIVGKIRDLGGRLISIENLKPMEDFILICADLRWTEKFVTACAQGMWVLLPEFIEESHKNGDWLDVMSYEWNLWSRYRSEVGHLHLVNVPRDCRCRVKASGRYAFHGWRVVLLVGNSSLRNIISRMLTRGGASVVQRKDCRDESIWKSVSHIFINSEFHSRRGKLVGDLKKRGCPCFDVDYIAKFISKLGQRTENDLTLAQSSANVLLLKTSLHRFVEDVLKFRTDENKSKEKFSSRKYPTQSRLQSEMSACAIVGPYEPASGLRSAKRSHLTTVRLPSMSREQIEQLMNDDVVVALKKLKKTDEAIEEISNSDVKRLEKKSINSVVPKKLKDKLVLNSDPALRNFGNVALERIGSETLFGSDRRNRPKIKKNSEDNVNLRHRIKTKKKAESLSECSARSLIENNGSNDDQTKDAASSIVVSKTEDTDEKSCIRLLPKLVFRLHPYKSKENLTVKTRLSSKSYVTDGRSELSPVKCLLEKVTGQQKFKKDSVSLGKRCVALATNNRLNPEETKAAFYGSEIHKHVKNQSNLSVVFRCDDPLPKDHSDLPIDLKSVEFSPVTRLNYGENKILDMSTSVSHKRIADDDLRNGSAIDRSSLPLVCERARLWPSSVVTLIDACLSGGEMQTPSAQIHSTTKIFLDAVSRFCTPLSWPPSSVLTVLLKKLVEQCSTNGEFAAPFFALVERILLFPTPASADIFPVYLDAVARFYGQRKPNWELIEHLITALCHCDNDTASDAPPNAELLMLSFVVKFLRMDFQQSKEKMISLGITRNRYPRWCILGRWLWTNEYSTVRSRNFVRLVSLLVKTVCRRKSFVALKSVEMVQRLVEMATDCWVFPTGYPGGDPVVIPQDIWSMAVIVAEELTGEKVKCRVVKLFLETCKVDWLALIVCRVLLDRMDPESIVDNSSVSLRLIVSYFHLRPFETAYNGTASGTSKGPALPKLKSRVLTPMKSPSAVHKQSRLKPSVVQSLKAKDINKQDSKGESKLHSACRKNNLRTVCELLEHPAIDVNLRDNAGWTPLHEACLSGNVEIVRALLSHRPKRTIDSFFETSKGSPSKRCVDLRPVSLADGITPLHDAVAGNQFEICRLLLQHGGRDLLDITDKRGRRPIDCVKSDEMKQILCDDSAVKNSEEQNTTPFLNSQADVSTMDTFAVHPVSKDLSEYYFLLSSNLLMIYLRCKKDRCSEDDREILRAMPEHLNGFKSYITRLQDGRLLDEQIVAFLKLEALVHFWCGS